MAGADSHRGSEGCFTNRLGSPYLYRTALRVNSGAVVEQLVSDISSCVSLWELSDR
jgi:hypothetical protein